MKSEKESKPANLELDPDFQEFKTQSSLRLIVSVDLRGSTYFKIKPRIKDPWILEIASFYRQFPMHLEIAYKDHLPLYCKSNPFDAQRRLTLFKLKGDEMLFQVQLDRHEHAVAHIHAVKQAVRSYNANDSQTNSLHAKACAWICGLPVTDFEIKEFHFERDGEKVPFPPDFVGPSMDIGFRISDEARTRKLVVSFDLALMLLHGLKKVSVAPENRALHFYYDGCKSLKGVLGGIPYPIIWINIFDLVPAPEEKLKGLNKNACNPDELEYFCKEFRTDHDLPKWFIAGDLDPDYSGPGLEWLERYKAYKSQLKEKGMELSGGAA